MKILAINSTEITRIGGINYSVKRVCEELARTGHECCVLSVNPGNLPSEETLNGVKIIRINSPISERLYHFSPAIIRFLRRNLGGALRPDIVHIHEYRSLLTLQAARLLGSKRLPFVFSPHYDRLGYNTFAGHHLMGCYKPFGSITFKLAETIIVNSEYTKDILLTDFGINPDKIEVIPHGVDTLEPPANKARKAPGSPVSLLYAGVLTGKKSVHYIIQALSEMKKRHREAHLTVIGEGDRELPLKSLAGKLAVGEDISWHPPLSGEELQRRFREADTFLLLSRDESYGIVVAEALAAGTPCIVAKTTALNEFLAEPGCFGVDYPPDPAEVADLIIRINDRDVRVGPFSRKIRTWDKVAQDYVKLYERFTG